MLGLGLSADPSGSLLNDRHDYVLVNDLARHTGWLHAPLVAFAQYGVVLFAFLLLAGWWVARRTNSAVTMAAALAAPVATVLAVAVNQPIVAQVREARPYVLLPHALVLVHRSTDPSFPSDHATMAGAVAAGLWLVSRRLGVIAAAAAVVMAFTRVYVGVHYPADVLAGLALGACVAVIVCLVTRRPLRWLITALMRSPLWPLVAPTRSR